MDINDLFDGITEAFRQYQAEIAEQTQASANQAPAGLELETAAEKTENKVATEKREEGNFPKRERFRSIRLNAQLDVSL
ncbi:MAG: hypothetical protein KKD63_12085 [Proteobacteria bacterium]|nr:hypothetical protein [Desulfobulbaceae bacterium]MBU4153610.1 hypothetical protein [Pseudomonadota bacterium]